MIVHNLKRTENIFGNNVKKRRMTITKIKIILLTTGLILTGCESKLDSYSSREAELNALLDGDDAFG